ncbi:MAG TPA: hypothetical protein VHC00_09505 [Rhizobiaceae bacterium]|nr:hypothetical protein [Rhizobiaceae bacterium]
MKRAIVIADRAAGVTFNLLLGLNVLFLLSFLVVALFVAFGR